MVNGKKLWEVLLTDANGSFRFCKTLPSSQVNSKELRRVVEEVIEESDVKPTVVRFFRGAMFNMINIALSDLDVVSKPSRCTFALSAWLEQRHRDVYPKLEGYESIHSYAYTYGCEHVCKCNLEPFKTNVCFRVIPFLTHSLTHLPTLLYTYVFSHHANNNNNNNKHSFKPTMMTNSRPSYLDVSTPLKLPDALRGEKYAFVGLPVGEFMEDGSIDETNIGTGRLCELPDGLPADSFVQGVVILTSRAKALASWLAGTEVVALTADLRKRTIVMETDIDTEYLMAKLNDEQRQEGLIFEEGKEAMKGLHFISVQQDENHDPEGFWLLRKLPQGI